MPSIILEIEIEKMLRTYRFYKRKEILDIRENSRFQSIQARDKHFEQFENLNFSKTNITIIHLLLSYDKYMIRKSICTIFLISKRNIFTAF